MPNLDTFLSDPAQRRVRIVYRNGELCLGRKVIVDVDDHHIRLFRDLPNEFVGFVEPASEKAAPVEIDHGGHRFSHAGGYSDPCAGSRKRRAIVRTIEAASHPAPNTTQPSRQPGAR